LSQLEFSNLPPIVEKIVDLNQRDTPIYLVGGAVRDAILSQTTHDLDFVLPENALEFARKVADHLHAAFYPLDPIRQYGRVILPATAGKRLVIDFTGLQGKTLKEDLLARDFTINAMAVGLHQSLNLFDPLGGLSDLKAKNLRACTPDSFKNDPIRILRGIRLAGAFELHIIPETLSLMRQAISLIQNASLERIRDELFRMLDGPKPSTSIRALDYLGVLPVILPELPPLKDLSQPEPHIADAWEHTLDVVHKLKAILSVLSPQYEPDLAASLSMGLISLRLGRFRSQIESHLTTQLNPERNLKSLLMLAALYHDVGKPATRMIDEHGRIRFLDHEHTGAQLASQRAQTLQLSNTEVYRLVLIVRHHMRPLYLSQTGQLPSNRAIYRLFRVCGEAGIDICLLSLADVLATYGSTLPQEVWSHHIDVVRSLFEAWWEYPSASISPPQLIKGSDLIQEFDLVPGPIIGQLLESIREAQAVGQIQDREQALQFARKHLEDIKDG
jgi:putative nucleotidyltransferase with HDIG domain